MTWLLTFIVATIWLFADDHDCLIYHPILTPTDHQILQEDLQKLSAWADQWKMKFNINKCCIMQLSKRYHKSEFLYICMIHMSGQVLKIVEQHPYLGVIIDHQLSWKPHVNYIASYEAKQWNNWINRNLRTCSKPLKELNYKQFVLPVLDYSYFIYLGSLYRLSGLMGFTIFTWSEVQKWHHRVIMQSTSGKCVHQILTDAHICIAGLAVSKSVHHETNRVGKE